MSKTNSLVHYHDFFKHVHHTIHIISSMNVCVILVCSRYFCLLVWFKICWNFYLVLLLFCLYVTVADLLFCVLAFPWKFHHKIKFYPIQIIRKREREGEDVWNLEIMSISIMPYIVKPVVLYENNNNNKTEACTQREQSHQ